MEPSPSFSHERLRRLAQIERWHFWFAGRRALVEGWLAEYVPPAGQRVYDVGCGTGALLESLQRRDYWVAGSDLRAEGLQAVKQNLPAVRLVQADATQLPWQSESFDTVLLLDVLEHVNDCAALRELYRILQPGGRLILTVPALPWLWSYRDEAAGHLRRYTRRQLRAVLNESGFEVRQIRYYQFLLLPLVLATRWLGRRQPVWREVEDLPAPWLNWALTRVNLFEVRLGRWLAWPCGSSLAAVCQRRKAHT
ncbi:MAG: class I SAM-dependent methyltransferase [Acidobacteria bacterium]|nr:class I SAM-dependent methyltransferase [Acidobacteriota bacterium]MBI3423760.1 class I SAM-dependent methyltransferase [Acidobacteriota bacterium]